MLQTRPSCTRAANGFACSRCESFENLRILYRPDREGTLAAKELREARAPRGGHGMTAELSYPRGVHPQLASVEYLQRGTGRKISLQKPGQGLGMRKASCWQTMWALDCTSPGCRDPNCVVRQCLTPWDLYLKARKCCGCLFLLHLPSEGMLPQMEFIQHAARTDLFPCAGRCPTLYPCDRLCAEPFAGLCASGLQDRGCQINIGNIEDSASAIPSSCQAPLSTDKILPEAHRSVSAGPHGMKP